MIEMQSLLILLKTDGSKMNGSINWRYLPQKIENKRISSVIAGDFLYKIYQSNYNVISELSELFLMNQHLY